MTLPENEDKGFRYTPHWRPGMVVVLCFHQCPAFILLNLGVSGSCKDEDMLETVQTEGNDTDEMIWKSRGNKHYRFLSESENEREEKTLTQQ